jgi:hypothetical protein
VQINKIAQMEKTRDAVLAALAPRLGEIRARAAALGDGGSRQSRPRLA